MTFVDDAREYCRIMGYHPDAWIAWYGNPITRPPEAEKDNTMEHIKKTTLTGPVEGSHRVTYSLKRYPKHRTSVIADDAISSYTIDDLSVDEEQAKLLAQHLHSLTCHRWVVVKNVESSETIYEAPAQAPYVPHGAAVDTGL